MERSMCLVAVRAVLAGLAFVVLGGLTFPSAGAAEEFEATHCYGGTSIAFHGSQELKPLADWVYNGIVRSPNKLLNGAATHGAGVQRGTGTTREGYVLAKIVDADGDIIVVGDHYAGLKFKLRFLEGTGKWRGITGDFESEPAASAAKPAMPDSFHTCTQWKGKYEVRK